MKRGLLTSSAIVIGMWTPQVVASAAIAGLGAAAVGGAGTHMAEVVKPAGSAAGIVSVEIAAFDEPYVGVLSGIDVMDREKPWTKPTWERPSLILNPEGEITIDLKELATQVRRSDAGIATLSEYPGAVMFNTEIDTAELTPTELYELGSYMEAQDPEGAKTNPTRSTLIVDWTLQAYIAGHDKALPRLHRYADEGGWNNGIAQNIVGLIYELGVRVKPDGVKSLDYFTRASQNSSGWGREQGIINLFMKEDPTRMPAEMLKAVTELAAAGDREAIYQLYKVLPSTDSRKEEYLKGAAELGHPIAGYELAERTFDNVFKRGKALEYLESASAQGSADATSVLSECYRQGVGMVKSEIDAERMKEISEKQRELFEARKVAYREGNEYPGFPMAGGIPMTSWVSSCLRADSWETLQYEWSVEEVVLKRYPLGIGAWHLRIKKLQIDDTRIISRHPHKLAELMGIVSQLTQLRELKLKLDSINMGDKGAELLAMTLKPLSKLTHLDINLICNGIGAEGGKAIGEALPYLTGLTALVLKLCSNNLQDEGVVSVALGLKFLTSLAKLELELGNNRIDDVGSVAIGELLPLLPKLKNLSLGLENSTIKHGGAMAVAMGLQTLTHLMQLKVSFRDNEIGKVWGIALGEALSCLRFLTELELYLANNDIQTEGVVALANGLKYLTGLSRLTLVLNKNNIDKHGGAAIGEVLPHLSGLTELTLVLEQNDIRNFGVVALATGLKSLTALMDLFLYLTRNSIGEVGGNSIGELLPHLIHLEHLSLDLSYNALRQTGVMGVVTGLRLLPREISLYLDLSSNRIAAARAIEDALSTIPWLWDEEFSVEGVITH